ncbi:uncharacterized protein LOC117315854 [Pecten maximus]|uniref:uncharacterized protein LOC117315854 n=1 Tax=Pecten maximus TaxID=6579 RepID=UPI001458DEAD|nr:uncharacterized protein LOC117315854 [Pecten maximus]
MAVRYLQFAVVLAFLTYCKAQSPPSNVTAVYVADGTIKVTWTPSTTLRIDNYSVEVQEAGRSSMTEYLSGDVNQYRYKNPKPSSTYIIKVSTIRSDRSSVASFTIVNAAEAIYRNRRNRTKLTLPRPPDTGTVTIKFNGASPFIFIDGRRFGRTVNANGVAVHLTSTNADLTIERTRMTHAGYYYVTTGSDNVLGGQLLVVTDTPSKPSVTASPKSPFLDGSVTLGCMSSSRSKPDNHGLLMTSTWKLNGTEVNYDRFSVQGTNLVIHPVQKGDNYNRFTCTTNEVGQSYTGLPSEKSEEFLLTPNSQSRFSLTNLTAVYEANGTIKVTWNPPMTSQGIDSYFVEVQEAENHNISNQSMSADISVYQYHNPKPDTTYTFNVSTIRADSIIGSSLISLNTSSAKYKKIGAATQMTLPKPPDTGTSTIQFNGQTLFTFTNGGIKGSIVSEDGVTVSVGPANVHLTIVDVKITNAGYYYTVTESGNVLGGQLLVVTVLVEEDI